MTKKRTPIGCSDFRTIITDNRYFVDKSLLIKEVVEGAEIQLYPRPRRFGKTLNLSMLKYFYDNKEDNSHLFNNLLISSESEIMQKQGQHPVIFITFKDVKKTNLDGCMKMIFSIIRDVYSENDFILDSDYLRQQEKEYYDKILNGKASLEDYEFSLKKLSEFLFRFYSIKPVILIDEYDTPINAAYLNNFYEEVIGFMRNFLSGGLKDNSYLEKGVLTGILRVAKESIFSGLNNIEINSILSYNSADKFGFTQLEVEQALVDHSMSDKIDEVKKMYNGYNIGEINIYNPWSILNYLNQKRPIPYWVNSSDNSLIKQLCLDADISAKRDLEILVENGRINKPITDDIVFSELSSNEKAIWSFLLMSGYLRYDNFKENELIHDYCADLIIPNKEIKTLFVTQILSKWFNRSIIEEDKIDDLLAHLTSGDISTFITSFKDYCESSFSYYDVAGDEPEKFYHAFVLGMLVTLRNKYDIRSNRESGLGRYDVMLIPHDKSQRGIIFEFKTVNPRQRETLEIAIVRAKKQIAEKNYAQELIDHGVTEIINVVVAFEGKKVELDVYDSSIKY